MWGVMLMVVPVVVPSAVVVTMVVAMARGWHGIGGALGGGG